MTDLEKNENPSVTPEKEQTPLEENETPIMAEEPKREKIYIRVCPGDTVESLAKEYDVDAQEIIDYNKINPDWLFVGHWLFI